MDDIDQLDIRDADGGAILPVKAVPGASRNRVAGVLGPALKVTVAAAAEKGKANKALATLLARALGVDRRAVTLLSGATSPHKEFHIAALSAGELRRRLERL